MGKTSILNQKLADVSVKHYDNPQPFIEYSDTMNDVCNNINDCNPNRNRNILIAFSDIIADINTNKIF